MSRKLLLLLLLCLIFLACCKQKTQNDFSHDYLPHDTYSAKTKNNNTVDESEIFVKEFFNQLKSFSEKNNPEKDILSFCKEFGKTVNLEPDADLKLWYIFSHNDETDPLYLHALIIEYLLFEKYPGVPGTGLYICNNIRSYLEEHPEIDIDFSALFIKGEKIPATNYYKKYQSIDLKDTLLVPTLDYPHIQGKNLIWCASFQLAWVKLKELLHDDVELETQPAVAEKLNSASAISEYIPEKESFSAAGFIKDGIIDTISTEMNERFGKTPDLSEFTGENILVYAYMETSIRFRYIFFDNNETFVFKDSLGRETKAASFGLREEDAYNFLNTIREQVRILYVQVHEEYPIAEQFIVDPCKYTKPDQLILACVQPLDTLKATVDWVVSYATEKINLEVNDTFLAPNMDWEILQHYSDLEQKNLLNDGFTGLYIDSAIQNIRFKLDKGGVDLVSEVAVAAAPMPLLYEFTKPFLVLLRKRDTKQPYFVMWVDNAELLVPAAGKNK